MKKLIYLPLLMFLALQVKGQNSRDVQKEMDNARKQMQALQSNPQYRQAMQRAQQAVTRLKSDTSLNRKMKAYSLRMDSLKKVHPELSGIQTPDVSSMGVLNMDSVMQTASASMDKAGQAMQGYTKALQSSLPQPNLMHHAESLPALKAADLTALATTILKQVTPELKMNPIEMTKLQEMIKDTSLDLGATGALMLTAGASPDAAAYLICNGVLKHPGDAWNANDLGAYLRSKQYYAQSLQCYFYANSLVPRPSAVINTNIGWASAYYGDFDGAKKYFDKALALQDDFTSALEGEALLAYQKGDIAALFQCLAKEVKFMGAGGGEPSDAFGTFCGGSLSGHEGNLDKQTEDPNEDHTFDNPSPDSGPGQGPPPGADVDPITYPRYRSVFVSDAGKIVPAVAECAKQAMQSMQELKSRQQKLDRELRTVKPLDPTPYTDDEGNRINPNAFAKYVYLFELVGESFEKRTAWFYTKLSDKLHALRPKVINGDADMMKEYDDALLKCAPLTGSAKDACANEANCTWLSKMYTSKTNNLDVVSKLWDDYYDHIAAAMRWYINASTPFISRVHDEGWNQYLNDKRELAVRSAVIQAYGMWQACLGNILSPDCYLIQQKPPVCAAIDINGMDPPDPFSKAPDHIREFQGHCYDVTYSTPLGSVEATCHATKYTLGKGAKVFWEHVDDPLYAKDQHYTNKYGTDISAGTDFELFNVGAEGKIAVQFDENGQLTGGSSSISGSASAGKLTLGGIEASRTMQIVAGQMQVSPLAVKVNGPSVDIP